MRFDLNDDQHEIRTTARELLALRCPASRVHELAGQAGEDPGLWAEMRELGWPGIAVAEEHGGAGMGLVELAVVLEEAGAALAPTPLLPTACAALILGRAGSAEQQARWLPALASGEATGAIGLVGPDGDAVLAGAVDAAVRIVVDEERAWIITDARGGEAFTTLDPLRRYALIRGAVDRGEPLPGDVARGVQEAATAVAAELTGVARRSLETTVEYVKQRRQFGTPVGAFQAVAHRCAEMLLHTESARSTVYYAAWVADAAPERLAEASALAKATASTAGVEVTAAAIQAHGGIGFTWEADVHWWYKRAQQSAQLLGGASAQRSRLGAILAEELVDVVA